MLWLRELLRGSSLRCFVPAGSCPTCGRRRAAPWCDECLAASAASLGAYRTRLGRHDLHFVGAYHDAAPGGRHRLSPLGSGLRAFKDQGDRYSGRCLSRLFADRFASLVATRHTVVPIPSDTGRLRRRGLSPATWLASSLARRGRARLCTNALTRVPGRPPQRGLDGIARRANASGAFVLGPCDVQGYSILLVDDVVTTGATLGDAARCLREAGAAAIVCVVLACADEELIRACRSTTASGGTRSIAQPPR